MTDPELLARLQEGLDMSRAGEPLAGIARLEEILADALEAGTATPLVEGAVHGIIARIYWFELHRPEEGALHSERGVEVLPDSERASVLHFNLLRAADQLDKGLAELRRYRSRRTSAEHDALIAEVVATLAAEHDG